MEPPSDPLTLGPDFFPFLNQFQQHPKAPYVHPRAISFRDAAHQDNWINYLDDARDRDTIINFYRTKKDGKSTWIGFCSCERINWVQYQDDWKTEPWHCSTIAVIQDQKKGKHLVVYDPDPSPHAISNARITSVLRGLQRNLFLWIRENKTKNIRVWYSVDRSHEGQNQCLIHSLRKVQTWAEVGDIKWQDENDPRTKDCIELTLV